MKKDQMYKQMDEALYNALHHVLRSYREFGKAIEQGDMDRKVGLGGFSAVDINGEEVEISVSAISTCAKHQIITIHGQDSHGRDRAISINVYSGATEVWDPSDSDKYEDGHPQLH